MNRRKTKKILKHLAKDKTVSGLKLLKEAMLRLVYRWEGS